MERPKFAKRNTAKIAAQNLAADLTDGPSHSLSISELGTVCSVDAANGAMAIETAACSGTGRPS